MGIANKVRQRLNAFLDRSEPVLESSFSFNRGGYGIGSSVRPHISRTRVTNERSIISSIYNRLAVDAAEIRIQHVALDPKTNKYLSDRQSGLQDCLSLRANVDQPARAFRQDIFATLIDKGVIAIVPVDTANVINLETGSYDIETLRVGHIVEFFPRHVKVNVYNDRKGIREDLILPKTSIAIVENPFYAVMNEPNSTLQRLASKLSMLDSIDAQAASGNLDLIIQLPYVIKSEARREQAEQRRADIESQLRDSTYGIAYTDGTERITQLNRPAENKLLKQIEYLTAQLYTQLGITPEIMNSTASEQVMLNYYRKTIMPMLDAVVEAMATTFLTKTARSQGQSIKYFRDPFALLTLGEFADIADKLTRNEIATANELRAGIGMSPSQEPKADKLQNSNMPQPQDPNDSGPQPTDTGMEGDLQNGSDEDQDA